MRTLCFVLFLMLLSACAPPPRDADTSSAAGQASAKPNAAETQPATSQGSSESAASLHILVLKKERLLQVYRGDKLVQSYKVGLGFAPDGPKYREGDGKTPEGDYYISVKNPKSQFYLSLGISYPNRLDAQRAWFNGRISRQQFDRIEDAISHHGTPPWNTDLGGAIYIHGYGSQRDWTHGCIALNNYDIERLYDMIPVGTPVTIRP